MPAPPSVRVAKARKAALARAVRNGERPADDHDYVEACRELNALNLESAVQQALAKAPRPTDEQLGRVAALLRVGA